MKITFLGTGTSCGVPVIGCQCEVCQSKEPKDRRLRCSILVETEDTRLLVDVGPDFREQILPQPFRRIDGILVTHSHYDHVGGMDDIRPYCQFGQIDVYADPIAREGMLQMLPYCFAENRYPVVPKIELNEIHAGQSFTIGDIEVMRRCSRASRCLWSMPCALISPITPTSWWTMHWRLPEGWGPDVPC